MEKTNVPELFGSLVFDDREMQARLSKEVYTSLRKTIDENVRLDEKVAEARKQGDSALESTYSGGSTPLYVMWPDDASVKVNKARIEMIMSEGYTMNTESAETAQN